MSEQGYYDIELRWEEDRFDSVELDRFKAAFTLIPSEVKTIADIGCGNGLFFNYLRESSRRFTKLVGVDRSLSALRRVTADKIRASIEYLPFETNAFDLITCLEVVEHLPVPHYQLGLSELCRVSSKYILISVPNNQNLRGSLIECPACKSRFNPDYHMRSFDKYNLSHLFDQYSFACIEVIQVGKIIKYYSPFKFLRKNLLNRYSFDIPCPVCGYFLEGTSQRTNQYNGRRDNPVLRMKSIVAKKILPRAIQYRWLAALYEKVT